MVQPNPKSGIKGPLDAVPFLCTGGNYATQTYQRTETRQEIRQGSQPDEGNQFAGIRDARRNQTLTYGV